MRLIENITARFAAAIVATIRRERAVLGCASRLASASRRDVGCLCLVDEWFGTEVISLIARLVSRAVAWIQSENAAGRERRLHRASPSVALTATIAASMRARPIRL